MSSGARGHRQAARSSDDGNHLQRGGRQQHRQRHDRRGRGGSGSSDGGRFHHDTHQSSRNFNRQPTSNSSAATVESKGNEDSSGSSSSSSDSDFLLSGAEKREKALRKQAQKERLKLASQQCTARSRVAANHVSVHSISTASSSSSSNSSSFTARPAPQLPGYYFDAQQNKYFKLLPSHIHTAAAGLDADDDSSILNQGSGRGLHAALALGKQMLQRAQQRIPIHTNPAKHSGSSSDKGRKHVTNSNEIQERRKRVKYDARVPNLELLSVSSDAADSIVNRSWSRSIHHQQSSRSILSSLVNREMRSTLGICPGIPAAHMLSPASLLQSRLPSLLTPVPFPFVRLQFPIDASHFPSTDAAIRAQVERDFYSADISGEHGFAYDAHAGLLSIAGNRSHIPTRQSEAEDAHPQQQQRQQRLTRADRTTRGRGGFHVTMRISENTNRYDRRILGALSSASGASSSTSLARLKDFEFQRRLNPFRMQCMSMFQVDSPITSIHRIHSWSPISHPTVASVAATARGAPLVFDSVRRYREQRRSEWIRGELMHDTTTSIWASESERVEQQQELNSEAVQNLIGYTLFGGQQEPGSFHLSMEDFTQADQQRPSEPQALFTHSVSNGSCWTSALPRSMHTNSLHGLRVALGCTKRGFVVDLISGARIAQVNSNKSDIWSQAWLTQGNSDSNLLLNGSRDGVIRTIDVRKSSSSSNSSWRNSPSSSSVSANLSSEGLPSIKMSSSVCWLQQLDSNPNHVLAAAVDGQLASYDIRRLAQSSVAVSSTTLTTPILSYLGHKNTFSQLIPTVSPSESHLYCGGHDGLVRVWDLKTTELVAESSPLRPVDLHAVLEPPSNSSSPSISLSSSAGRRLVEWKQVLFLEEFDTLLAGGEAGIAAMNLVRRQRVDQI